MKKAITTITTWANDLSGLLQALIVLGILTGILFDDYFGVVAGISRLMDSIGQGGLAGLVALVLVVTWWKKK
tara:strand:- start:1507 stop:1722 length:216 start_codon:yes stop_codon:yes gene_type:complete